MKKLFAPAAWLAGRLSFRHKLLVTAAAFLVPLLILAGLLLLEQQKALDLTIRERAGLAVQLPAIELLAATHEHHASLQAVHAGDEQFRQRIAQQREQVESALNKLRAQTRTDLAKH
jgi:methyl-accepting chemotaxis protein